MSKIKRVAAYCRVSTDEQVLHGYSLGAQRDALAQYAANHELNIIKFYVDEGISGKLPFTKRPAMMRMLSDLEALNIQQVIFIKLDRWFRSVKEYYKVQDILDRHKVTWRAILEDYNTETSDGILKVNIMLSVAQNEAERTSERIKFVMHNKMEKKQVVGKQPYGYKIAEIDGVKRSVIDEETAPVVRDIFREFERTSSASLTTKYVNTKYSTAFSYVFVRRLLKRSSYAGEYMGITDYRPAYITREQYDRNVATLESRHVKRTPTGRIYIFSGLLFCACCGHRLKAKRAKNGSRYYCCTRAMDDYACVNRKHISELKLEAYLTDNIVRLAEKYIYDVEVSKAAADYAAQKRDVEAIRRRLDRLNDIYLDGNIDKSVYIKKSALIRAELDEAIEFNAKIKPKDIKTVKNFLDSDILSGYEKLNAEGRRTFWRRIIDRIELDEERNISVFFL